MFNLVKPLSSKESEALAQSAILREGAREVGNAILSEVGKKIKEPTSELLKSFIGGLLAIVGIFLLLKLNGALIAFKEVPDYMLFLLFCFQIQLWYMFLVISVVLPIKIIKSL